MNTEKIQQLESRIAQLEKLIKLSEEEKAKVYRAITKILKDVYENQRISILCLAQSIQTAINLTLHTNQAFRAIAESSAVNCELLDIISQSETSCDHLSAIAQNLLAKFGALPDGVDLPG
jgi:hypothetical protein